VCGAAGTVSIIITYTRDQAAASSQSLKAAAVKTQQQTATAEETNPPQHPSG
jgi:hypothetical protein